MSIVALCQRDALRCGSIVAFVIVLPALETEVQRFRAFHTGIGAKADLVKDSIASLFFVVPFAHAAARLPIPTTRGCSTSPASRVQR